MSGVTLERVREDATKLIVCRHTRKKGAEE